REDDMSTRKLSLWALPLALVLFLAVNIFAQAALRHTRIDLTEDREYTLSQGSRNVCAQVAEPIALTYYFSDKVAGELPVPDYRLYGVRVKEFLEEYALASGGKIKLRVVEPEPYSEEQDAADAAGLAGLPANQSGDMLYMGLVGKNSVGDSKTI